MTTVAGDDHGHAASHERVHIKVLHVPDCVLLDGVLAVIDRSLTATGISAGIEEVVGDFASPTVLVDGADVTGRAVTAGAACRLDVPSEAQVRAALVRRTQCQESSMSGDVRDGEVRPSRIPLACSPPRLAADTPAKRLADRVLPKGVGQWIYFALVAVGAGVVPGLLPLRPSLGVALAATVAASWWCLVNFWRCREAHCMVSGIGWAGLAALEIVEVALGRELSLRQRRPGLPRGPGPGPRL